MIWVWQNTYQISRKALGALLDLLLLVDDDGTGFDVRGLDGVRAEHFNNRMRKYLPLLEVFERDVPSTTDGESTAKVRDIPVNLLVDRLMKLSSETAVSEAFPGGKLLRGQETADNSLASEHVNCIPTLPRDGRRRSNMHGTLARSTPFAGVDGVKGSSSGRKVYVHDVCVANVNGAPAPFRILEIFWDADTSERVMVRARGFRPASDVRGVGEEDKRQGLLRVWEDLTPEAEVVLDVGDVLDVCEIYARADLDAHKHEGEWELGARSDAWEACISEGFVVASAQKRRRAGDPAPRPFAISHTPWSVEGTPEDPLFSLRREGFHLNGDNLPLFSAPLTMFNDAFNCHGMGNEVCVRLLYVYQCSRRVSPVQNELNTHPTSTSRCTDIYM